MCKKSYVDEELTVFFYATSGLVCGTVTLAVAFASHIIVLQSTCMCIPVLFVPSISYITTMGKLYNICIAKEMAYFVN